jgi:hypothetical protein
MDNRFQRFLPKISGYILTGYNLKLYVKLTESNVGKSDYMCVLSFGTGMKKFCLTALYKNINPTEIYIDRVQNNDLCVIDGKLRDYEKGTVKLVKIALYTIKQLFPDVTKLSLHDDSQIYCDETNNLFKLSLSYDYILKYNESWYQKNFSAELPGFKSKQNTNIIYEDGSLMANYVKSLSNLDEPIMPYPLIINIFPQFSEYKDEYESAKTPREFINRLRKTLKDDFCFKVGKWLNQYMLTLHIKLSAEHWYILSKNIELVPNFTMTKLKDENAKRILDGGGKTRKNNKKMGFRIVSDSNLTDICVGYYDEYNK